MSAEFSIILYLLIGIVLSLIWDCNEHEDLYDDFKENDTTNFFSRIIKFILMVIFWPIKLFKTVFESIFFV